MQQSIQRNDNAKKLLTSLADNSSSAWLPLLKTSLTTRQMIIVLCRYNLPTKVATEKSYSPLEIADLVDVTPQRVHAINRQALKCLRRNKEAWPDTSSMDVRDLRFYMLLKYGSQSGTLSTLAVSSPTVRPQFVAEIRSLNRPDLLDALRLDRGTKLIKLGRGKLLEIWSKDGDIIALDADDVTVLEVDKS